MDSKYFESLKGLISGYVNMASRCAPLMKQRSMDAVCFFHKDPDEVLAGLAELEGIDASFTQGRLNLRRKLYEVLGNNYTGRKVARLLESELAWELGRGCTIWEPVNKQEVCEALSGFKGGPAPFYIVEDMFLAAFDEVTIMFCIGSDE